MSYPPYQQGYGQNPNYGGPPYSQSNFAPYPNTQSPYPTNLPPSGGVFPPSLGFATNAPIYMPMPMAPGYPPQPPQTSSSYSSPYPNSSYSPRPNVTSYPSTPSAPGYPNLGGNFPTTTYPTSGTAHVRSSYPGASSYPNAHQQHSSASYPTSGSYRQHAPPPSQTTYHVHTPYDRKTTPTVLPANPFSAKADAEILRKAMKGFGTDEKAIIGVLSRRSNMQRLQIAVEFKTMYGKDLIKDLKSETSGKFEDLVVALMTPLPQFYAKELHAGISGLGTDEDVLIEVLCTKTNNEIRTIRAAYHSMYGRSLEDDLIGDTSGTFKRLMVSLCNACRDESTVTNSAAAAKDAQDLLRAGELKLGTDESTFNMILCQRSYAQLRMIFDEYYRITGHDIENAIKNEFSGNSKDALLAIIRSIRNQPGFFAKCLHNAIAGLGTDDRKLIRVVVTRSEIDMGEIKQNYLAQYGETLADAIKGDTSGDYRKCLFALIGEA